MSGFVRMFGGLFLSVAMCGPGVAAGSSGIVTLDIQPTKPIAIVWSTANSRDGSIVVTGLVRHRGPPWRNSIYGHVVATLDGGIANGAPRIDVPVVRMANPHRTAREARFSFTLPATSGDSGVVHLRYVSIPMPAP